MSEKKRFSFIQKTVSVMLILMTIYVLSAGPVFAIFVSGKHDKEAYESFISFYAPIVWADQTTPLKKIIGPYLMFWERVFN